jgi:hypothetical protein
LANLVLVKYLVLVEYLRLPETQLAQQQLPQRHLRYKY